MAGIASCPTGRSVPPHPRVQNYGKIFKCKKFSCLFSFIMYNFAHAKDEPAALQAGSAYCSRIQRSQSPRHTL